MRNHAAHATKQTKPIPVMTSAFLNFGTSSASQVIPDMTAMANRMCMEER